MFVIKWPDPDSILSVLFFSTLIDLYSGHATIIKGQENELLLMSVLDCLYNAVSQILRKNVDKKSLFDNLEVSSKQSSCTRSFHSSNIPATKSEI